MGPPSGPRRAAAALAVVHPFPSALNALLVLALATVAGAEPPIALVLALAMLGFQVSIGALNDLVDAPVDAINQPRKPIPARLVPVRAARAIAITGGVVGLVISATFGMVVLGAAIVGYGSGLAYDLVLRRVGLGWLAFAIAFPALLVWTWQAAAGEPPPGAVALLPMAALAGPAIHLANALVDPVADAAAGVRTLATSIGDAWALRTLAAMQVVLFGLGWLTLDLIGRPDVGSLLLAIAGSGLAILGVVLSGSARVQRRDIGWMTQAVAVACMGVAWLGATVTGAIEH